MGRSLGINGTYRLTTLLAMAAIFGSTAVAQDQAPGASTPNAVATIPAAAKSSPAAGPAVPSGAPQAGLSIMPLAATLPQQAAPQQASATPHPSEPGLEGIKVHGRWIIDIRNPDGTLAQHHEFENALAGSGGGLLVGFLSGQLSAGDFLVILGGPSGGAAGPCQGSQYAFCGFVQSTTTTPGNYYCSYYLCSANLTVTPAYGSNFAGPYTLTLAGSITANQAGSIGYVQTSMAACAATQPGNNPSGPTTILPATCEAETDMSNFYYSRLTATSPTPINVANGQLIQVQVVISFS